MSRTMVLVTGAGRSGTSTAAGTLSHLGVHVPGPFLKANESNPKGFYESRWSVQFHNRLLQRANVSLADTRPEALDLVTQAVREQQRERLRDWLATATEGHPVSALKDPRTTWALTLWSQAGDDLGVAIRFLTMLRHPAEVIGSRATHYSRGIDVLGERGFAVKNLGGWVNAMLLTEQQTRGRRRAFVRYDDLLADWRAAMAAAAESLGVDLSPDAETAASVDEFIDPDLSRHHLTWDDVAVPPALQEVAETVWQASDRLVSAGGSDAEAEAAMDSARERYVEVYRDAQALTHDATAALVKTAGAEAAREARAGDQEHQSDTAVAARRQDQSRNRAQGVLGRVRRRLR